MEGLTVLIVVTLVQINFVCLIYQAKTIVKAIYKYMKLFDWENDANNKE